MIILPFSLVASMIDRNIDVFFSLDSNSSKSYNYWYSRCWMCLGSCKCHKIKFIEVHKCRTLKSSIT
jgi:hypothetical protein